MTKEEMLVGLEQNDGIIYGYMYASPWRKQNERSEIIKMHIQKERVHDDGFFHVWGWPGPDYDEYYFSDYGVTWAFSPEEIKGVPYDDWRKLVDVRWQETHHPSNS